jgi:hypothetical protein
MVDAVLGTKVMGAAVPRLYAVTVIVLNATAVAVVLAMVNPAAIFVVVAVVLVWVATVP